MELLWVVCTSAGSVLLLFLLTKIMGNKQMSQLSMFDYINGITIGSIAAEMATDLENFEKPLVALIVYALLSLLISVAGYKSIRLRRFLTGKSLLIYEDGRLFEENLKKARIDVNEFLTQCRINGYFNLNDLQCAILEPNGKISFLPLSEKRPATPRDLGLSPPGERPLIHIVIDGCVLEENLRFAGKSEQWLQGKLAERSLRLQDVFLASCDKQDAFYAYEKTRLKLTRDLFQ